jgi:hypothetical protein
MWANWLQTAEFLLEQTNAEYLLLCEDDIELCPAAAERLQRGLAEFSPATFGLASLYTPLHNLPGQGRLNPGWHGWFLGRINWGSLAYCFSRHSLHRVLNSQTLRRHVTDKHTDSVLGAACIELGLYMHFHVPSLASHTGAGCSTVDHIPMPDSAAIDFDRNFGA